LEVRGHEAVDVRISRTLPGGGGERFWLRRERKTASRRLKIRNRRVLQVPIRIILNYYDIELAAEGVYFLATLDGKYSSCWVLADSSHR
jgi:hypothetical protein